MSFFRMLFKRSFFNIKTLIVIILMTVLIPVLVVSLSAVEDDGYVYHLALIDRDKTELSEYFYDSIKNSAGMTVIEDISYEDALRELNLGKLDIVYIIKEGFEENVEGGNYRNLIKWIQSAETVSTSWMNDQLSVGVIRHWLKVDIVNRIREIDPDFTYERFVDEFEKYYNQNMLIDHRVIEIKGEKISPVESRPLAEVYFFNLWGILVLVWVWLQNRIIIDDMNHNIIDRIKMTNGSSWIYYFTRLMLQIVILMIPWIVSYGYMTKSYFDYELNVQLFKLPLYIVSIFMISLIIIKILKSKKSYTMLGYVFILLNVMLSSDLVGGILSVTNLIRKVLPLFWFVK